MAMDNDILNRPRLLSLDFIRGIAVMGILVMNIIGFAMPEAAYTLPNISGEATTVDLIVWGSAFLIVDGKMRVCHYYLIWFGDILFAYAACGCIAFMFRQWSPEALIRRALLVYAMGFMFFAAMMGSLLYFQSWVAGQAAEATAGQMQQITEYEGMLSIFSYSAEAFQDSLNLYRGGYLDIFQYQISEGLLIPLTGALLALLESLPLMMIGMALFKTGFFTGQWSQSRYLGFGLKALIIGLLLYVPLLAWAIMANYDAVNLYSISLAGAWPPRLAMTLGYAALILWFLQRPRRQIKGLDFAAAIRGVGRMAFSNYIGTSLLMTFIFYGWGLGLYGHYTRAELYVFVAIAWVIMLLWSSLWLRFFTHGPLEWLWRSLAGGQLQLLQSILISANRIAGDIMVVCVCNAIGEKQLRSAVRSGAEKPNDVYALLGRKPKCGQCLSFAKTIIDSERATA